ncbi:MAG: sulfotransferase domain-containing protein [Flavobacteriales bacterium]|nr:sulfotransferase domain-containing protein [Flavobacteriales bacterium]MCB9192432.1 sulfotransferase domain-containing protein [Flavobacteriales bacterium]MCB9204522.1 sulfotransferase domain-containing protein [Flavobacteriales bacterium]
MKCGTSSLHRTLVQHPNLIASIKKEVHYFDESKNFQKGKNWYLAHFPLKLTVWLKQKISGKKHLTFEATPSYVAFPHVAERLKEVNPDAKIIVMFRNPVDRAYSHYFHSFRPLREKLPFDEAIAAEPDRLNGEFEKMEADPNYWSQSFARFSYLARGMYGDQMERWFKYFPKEQIMIIDSSYYYKNTQKCYNEVLDFLGLEHYEPKGFKKSVYPSYDKMSDELRQKLVAYFKPHNQKLYDLIGQQYDWDK